MSNSTSRLTDRAIQIIAENKIRAAIVIAVLPLLTASASAAELHWLNDLEKAKQVATTQHKDLLINLRVSGN